ncbi:alkylated DNA repair protein (DNA oxidative demethylase) [Methylobacterium phyllostachyos]|uniref:Alkylated DNA repair protein (DNA oxidative demethylase) n=1 Tax=Methylobacterium phyllostachyos TaxID=582672 RepID=A0A1G9VPU4_9HYPH|nr:alpha-ketoglutarate-dependent dioxygenase AlkB [Methylobacterium phyllostachyos]SDM73981.1 alkylated DNA repair protein (DNA oxidative demethylase) [Methylobacterium phyllostachyos]
MATELAPGLIHHPGFLDPVARRRLADEVAAVLDAAPPVIPRMPRTGRALSVRMSNAGPLGWVSDRDGYRYQPTHPKTGQPWPAIPETALAAWEALAQYPAPPEACLINLYDPAARMGLHQDKDETDFSAPVVSLSLGAPALFRYGGLGRADPTRSIRLSDGDAVVIGGVSRLIFHGIDRLYPSADLLTEAPLPGLLPAGGRCNLTLRRVSATTGRWG